MLAAYKIRIFANACLTRFDAGEGAIDDIVDSYNLANDDRNLVLAQIYAKRPEIDSASSSA